VLAPVIIAQTGRALPWTPPRGDGAEQGERFMAAPPRPVNGLLGALADVPNMTGVRVAIVRTFSAAFTSAAQHGRGCAHRAAHELADTVDPACVRCIRPRCRA
jgi:hypothetical protein